MSALKKKQVSVFSGVLTIPAQLQSDESKKRLFEESGAEREEPVINKRTKVQHNNDPRHMRNFEESMRSYLTSRILDVLKKGKATTLEKNIVKLKEGLSSATRLPIGIMGKAAELSGLEPSVMKNYMDNNAEKLTLNLWKQYVEENFDKIAQSVKGRNLSFPTASTSSSSAKKTEEIYRTFSVSLKKVLRDDMDGQVNDVVRRKLQLAMEECSILRAQYLLVLQIFIMLLKRNSLVEIDGRIDSVPTVGFDLRKLLPQYFVELGDLNNPITTCCPLLPPNASEMFTKDANLLFTEQHLQLIFSHFFGLKGSTQKSLDAHPVQSALFDLLPKDSFEGVFELSKVQSEQKSILSTSILTNISNMWGDNKIFSKLLDKLLIVLLRLHLAPVRAALNYKKWKSREPNNSSTSSSSSTTPLIQSQQKRNIVRAEHKKLRKRLEKLESCHDVDKEAALMKGITNNELRIAYFKNLPSKKKIQPLVPEQIRKDNDDEDDQQEIDDVTDDNDQQETNDLSSGRIRSLKSLAKHMLLSFSDEEISQERIQDELIDGTQKEIEVLMSIVKSLKAYIPKRDDRFIIAQQLPFCILANDVLRATGYSFFTLKLFPEPKFSSSVSLELSATSLYQLLTSGPNPLVIADFNNSKIDSIDYARSNKDASFCSIFNLITLNQVGASYKLKFAHRISILPGLKTVRILGTKEVPLAQPDTGNNASYLSKIMSNPNIVEEAKKKKEDLQSEIFTCNDDLKKHQRELKDLLKKDAIRELSKRIKDLKKKRLGESDKRVKDELTTAIATLKSTRYNEHTQIQCRRQQVSVVKQYIYFKQMAIRYHKQLSSKESVAAVQKRKLEVASENHGLFKAEECRIEKDSKCTFSGTDNGVVNLSATVPFDQSRFSFHLDLYNKYEILKEDGADITLHEDEKKYLDLAHPVLIKPDDIDVGCGFRKARKKLERRKRNSEDGKQVLAAEKILAENSLKNASTIPNLLDAVKLHQQPSQIIRSFYDSAKQARSSRAVEIQKKRFLQILVTKERKSLKEKGAQSIMFVGDRGTGVGSRIKGYRRYGGKWLMEMRGKRGVVCITNEHNTSQTCLFCYQKLDHPRRILKEGNTEKEKKVSGVLLCVNPKCISVITGHATKARDALSAMAIGISGASNCFLGETLHCFSPYKISQSATESLKTNTASFLRGKADLSKA